VGFWRRREPLHERLLRESGVEGTPVEAEPRSDGWRQLGGEPALDEAGITGLHRFREWQATATVEAPGLEGDEVSFVVLPDGSVLVDEEAGDTPLTALAEALEVQLAPPYRAHGVRRRGDVWAVGANPIEVVDLRPDVEGDELELVWSGGERSLAVDGARSFRSIPQLEELAARRSTDYVVHASRLDGSLWEVRVTPL
jgi:hypothetical protein